MTRGIGVHCCANNRLHTGESLPVTVVDYAPNGLGQPTRAGGKRAAEARDVMKNHGINPKTEPANKAAIPGDKHDITKRDSYVRDTNQRVAAQPNAEAVKAECCRIADNLQQSTFHELNKQYPAK